MILNRNNFVEAIAPLIVSEGLKRGYKIFSPVIAQAVIESRYGESGLAKYNNFFGLKCGSKWKGKSVNMKTKEEYKVGTLTTIKDNFRAYDTIEDGVAGYYDFISTKRYANLKNAQSPYEYCSLLKADGYATSSSYVSTLTNTIKKLNLTRFDVPAPIPLYRDLDKVNTSVVIQDPIFKGKGVDEVAHEVILGLWGNGLERKTKLKKAGYDPTTIQKRVNQMLKGR